MRGGQIRVPLLAKGNFVADENETPARTDFANLFLSLKRISTISAMNKDHAILTLWVGTRDNVGYL